MGNPFDQSDVEAMLHGKTECPFCGVFTRCYALHRCAPQVAKPVQRPIEAPEPWSKPKPWREN